MIRTDCFFCGSAFQQLVLSLGEQPLAGAYVRPEDLSRPERRYPLDLYLCEDCHLTHTAQAATSEEILSDYVYYSSVSESWLDHAARYVDDVIRRFDLNRTHFVLEIASNDGYLLKNFVQRNIRCLGIEPAAAVAQAALAHGVDTRVAYWGPEVAEDLVEEGMQADLIVANNVFAHTPDPNGFLEGIVRVLKPGGVLTMEFPHLYRLVNSHQFDTIHHEHFSYFALFVVKKMFARHDLVLFDAEELPTQGGSLRVYACHRTDRSKALSPRVGEIMAMEEAAGMMRLDYYHDFAKAVHKSRAEIRRFFEKARRQGKRIAGYGAPTKGNVLLNYCGIEADQLPYTVDRNPHKLGLHLPGTRIPIVPIEHIAEDRPDYLFLLPWNLREEIAAQMAHIRDWGGRFVVPIPRVEVFG
jgi:SAM-dependent methyltransferase